MKIKISPVLGHRALLLAVLVLTVFTKANAQGAAAPPAGAAPAGGNITISAQLWNTFVSVFSVPFTVSTFTPDVAITVTRIQAQVGVAPKGCKTNAVLQISDGGTPPTTATLAIATAANDSGPIAVNYAAGVPITLSVSTPAACGILDIGAPALGNVIVQYSTTTSGGGDGKAPAGDSAAPAAGS
jgi:hypothetical protein